MPVRCAILLLCASLSPAAVLRIEIARGDEVNNRAGSRGPAPAVRVTDDKGKPVAGALVIFTAPSLAASSSGAASSGTTADVASLDFGNGPVAQASTDESGTAVAPAPRPVGRNGPVRIEVLAEKDGATAHGVIDEMNVGASPADVAGDMEIVTVPDAAGTKAPGGKRLLRVRVTDLAGKPLVGVSVGIRLYPDKNSVQEVRAQSNAEGIADIQVDAKLLKGMTEIAVTAFANGVTATRVVAVAQVP